MCEISLVSLSLSLSLSWSQLQLWACINLTTAPAAAISLWRINYLFDYITCRLNTTANNWAYCHTGRNLYCGVLHIYNSFPRQLSWHQQLWLKWQPKLVRIFRTQIFFKHVLTLCVCSMYESETTKKFGYFRRDNFTRNQMFFLKNFAVYSSCILCSHRLLLLRQSSRRRLQGDMQNCK